MSESKCPRHRVERVRVTNRSKKCGTSTYCPVCHREASRAWNRDNRDRVDGYRAKGRAKRGRLG